MYEDLIIMLQTGIDGSWTYIPSVEERMEKAPSDSYFKFPLNADGIVERRWNAPQGSRLALWKRNELKPFAYVVVPDLNYKMDPTVDVYFPVKPVD